MSKGRLAGQDAIALVTRAAARIVHVVLTFSISFLLAVILLLMFAQAVDRYLIASGFSAYEQYSKFALVWLVFLGFPLAVLHHESITADLIGRYLGKRNLWLRDIVFNLLMAAMAVALIWYGIPVMRVGAFQEILGTPFTYQSIYLSFNLGMALVAAILIGRALSSLLVSARRP